jgi:hypothetical protein
MNTTNTLNATGVKGADCYASTGKALCDLYVMLNRGLDSATIKTAIDEIFTTGSDQDKMDAVVLAFQTRAIRGGKGERDLARHMLEAIYAQRAVVGQEAVLATLDLVPEYGYWEDINRLAQLGHVGLEDACVKLISSQFVKDETSLAGASDAGVSPKLSLVARHMPREKGNKAADVLLAKKLARFLSPGDAKANEKYRKRLVAVTKALGVAETFMSAKDWSSLNPATMPGRCLKTHIKALLNQPVTGKHGRKVVLADPDRVTCAAKFSEHLGRASKGEATVKGADVVFPHELVKKVLTHLAQPETIYQQRAGKEHNGCKCCGEEGYDSNDERVGWSYDYVTVPNPARLTAAELDALEAQWRSIVDPIKAMGTLGRWLAMCDFSGSMSGDPMWVSMALGLIIAECNTGVFKDCILTFDSKPTLHRFRTKGLVARVEEVRHLAQGLSTDFQAAYNLVLQKLVDAGVPAGQEPTELVVLTDMGFDAACGFGSNSYKKAVKTRGHETHFQIARRAFVKTGEALFGDGKGWAAPRIVCWNLRAEYKDFQATATEEGVLQVSGWSPSMLRVLTTRGLEAFTPEAILRAVLTDPLFDRVRERLTPIFAPKPTITISASASASAPALDTYPGLPESPV